MEYPVVWLDFLFETAFALSRRSCPSSSSPSVRPGGSRSSSGSEPDFRTHPCSKWRSIDGQLIRRHIQYKISSCIYESISFPDGLKGERFALTLTSTQPFAALIQCVDVFDPKRRDMIFHLRHA
jgi:hypothetical protein